MKQKLSEISGILFAFIFSCNGTYAQLLPPQALSYERSGKNAIELSWKSPDIYRSYSLYNLTEWFPQSYFYTEPALSQVQDCVISDGKFIYSSSVAEEKAGQFHRFDLTGRFLETIHIPGLPVIYMMTYDGRYFYGTQYGMPGMYKIDMDKKELVSIIPTPVNLYHITYIPTLDNGNGGFEAGDPSQGHYLKKDGNYLSSGPSYSGYNCSSTAYYNGKLYAFCQTPGSLKEILEFDAATGQSTGNRLDLNDWIGSAGIILSQMAIDLNFYESSTGTMFALITCYYTTTTEGGTIVSFFEIGKRPELTGLQGYNVYKNDEKQNTTLIPSTLFSYKSEGLDEETDYSYRVDAVYTDEQLSGSQVLTVRLPKYVNFGGTVYLTDKPLEDATIRLEKPDGKAVVYQTNTDKTGNFLFTGIEKGIYKLMVLKEDKALYVNLNYAIESENTTASIQIDNSLLQIDVSPVHVLLGENKEKTVHLPVSNIGNAASEWNAAINYNTLGTGKETGESNLSQAPMWETGKSFSFKALDETGLIFHKNYYYTMGGRTYGDPSSYLLRKYTTEGELVHTYTIITPVQNNVQGFVSDGETLYEISAGVDNGTYSPSIPGKLNPIDFENSVIDESHSVVTDFNEAGFVKYAAYDPIHDGFYIGSDHVFYRIDRTGKIQKTYDGIVYSYTRNIALDTFSEGGPYLWLFCGKAIAGYGDSDDRANILQFSLKDETMTNISHSIRDMPDYDNSAIVTTAGFFGTTALIPGYFVIGGAAKFSNRYMNLRTSLFTYKMFPYENWISLEKTTGAIEGGKSDDFSFQLRSDMLKDGEEREATIEITSDFQAKLEIPVKLIVDNLGEGNCLPPQSPTASVNETYQVELTWSTPEKAGQIRGYNIYRNGKKINKELNSTTGYVDVIPGMGVQTYTIRALYESECESSNSETVEIFVSNPEIVRPVTGLKTSVVNKKHVQLSWITPTYGRGLFDDFESYRAFTIQTIGNWTLLDGDKSWTYYNSSIFYLNQGSQMAFMVFNPSNCMPAASDITTCDEKKQFLACFSANVDLLANNDWLISPLLDFDRTFTFSFMGKTQSPQYGFEKINIGYSLTGNAPEDFIFINGNTPVSIADVWWKYEYQIPANAKYVAINCVTMNGLMLAIDNIYIGYPEYYSDLSGYNIYRNNEKLNTALLKANAYSEYDLEDGSYIYEIEAVFANGTTSRATSEPVEINSAHEATPPRNLKAQRVNNRIQLSWLPPLWSEPKAFRYDDGVPSNSIGGVDEEQLIGIRWDGSDLNTFQGFSITGVQFHIAEPVAYVVPFLFENGTLAGGGEEMQVEPGKYTEFLFETPIIIRKDTEYIIGYSYKTTGSDYDPASHDKGPGLPGKSDLISIDGRDWYSAAQLWGAEFNFNWNIAMLVELRAEAGSQETPVFYGYNLYKDNVKLNNEPVTGLSYTDEDDGKRKEYYVTAVYETEGEKSSNPAVIYNVGIALVNNDLVTIYPNPADDKIFVKGEFDVLELISFAGIKALSIQPDGKDITEVNIQNLTSGVYLLRMVKGNSTDYRKIIIK
jgi:hypothetical protein